MIENLINPYLKVLRDDLFPFLGGGNKGRKMEFIGKKIVKDEADALVTTGGIQSNHCRAVAIYAAKHKMRCTLVLHGDKEKFLVQNGNAKIMRLSGVNCVFVENPEEIGGKMDSAMGYYRQSGFKPYYIQGGGHTLEGGLAYMEAVKEIKEFSVKKKWEPHFIFLASGTGSTQSGIMAGLDKFGLDNTKVIGISVGRKSDKAEAVVKEFYEKLIFKYDIYSQDREAVVLDDYLLGGYGNYNKELKDFCQNSIRRFGFTLDTCYTGKAFWGMDDFIKKNNLQNKNILFWHTGGIFNFLAE